MSEADDFIVILREQVEATVKKIKELVHERQGIDMQIARTEDYISKLNDFLIEKGKEPVEYSKPLQRKE